MPDQHPISLVSLAKVSTLGAGLLAALISIVWFLAGLEMNITKINTQTVIDQQIHQTEVTQTDNRLVHLETYADQNKTDMSNVKSKIDVMSAILDRVDQKISGSVPSTQP